MKRLPLKVLWITIFAAFTFSCRQENPQENQHEKAPKFAADDLPPTNDTLRHLNIVWEKKEKKISHNIYFSEYGRIKRLSKDTLLLVYHCGSKKNEWDNIALRKSADNGKTWSPVQIIVPDRHPQKYSGFSTPDLLVLKNKWLVLAYTGRGIPDDSIHNNLQVRLSKDRGNTWQRPEVVSLGRSWEPGMVQLPDGEIQLFYSNELVSSKRAKGRHEQKVLMVSSKDNGLSWSKPIMVAFTAGRRDGMPIPLVLQDNKGILIALEAVENERSPEIVWTSMKANWNYKQVGTWQNGRRWVGSVDPVWGGAPCIIQIPTGEIIISMQTEGGRKLDRYTEWKKNTVVVMVGNSIGKNFNNLTFPYPDLPENEGRYFCSIFLKDNHTLALITTRNYPDGRSEIFWKEGRIYSRPM